MSYCLRITHLPIRFLPFHRRFKRQCGVLCRSYCNNRDNPLVIMEHVVFDGAQVMVGDIPLLQSKISSIRRQGHSQLQASTGQFSAILNLAKFCVHLTMENNNNQVRVLAEVEKEVNRLMSSIFRVIADFDATLTKYMIDGQRGHSSHALLQQGNPEYDLKRQKLYEYYHPLEIDPAIPLDEKAKLMEEWWEKTHALLVEGGLSFGAIRSSVAKSRIAFRDGVTELFELLERNNVPVLIFSAGLADIIEEVLRQKLHRPFRNVKIVSNRMVFDQDDNLVSFKGKTIHVLNKNEHAIDMAGPFHEEHGCTEESTDDAASVKLRTNVLLLGDHIGDLGMSDGLNYNTRISVGFLNDNIESSSDSYRNAFDVVYMNDASMWGVVKLASKLCSTLSDEAVNSDPFLPK